MDPLTPPHPFSALHSGAKEAGFLTPGKVLRISGNHNYINI